MAGGPEEIAGYRFRTEDLRVNSRKPGISAFMRIKNGAEWLELSIRSHLRFFDEIVAVYNQCTDATPQILQRLQQEFGSEKLRVIHYLDQVHPPGSELHARTEPTSPNSLVNYYNFSLVSTKYRYATKLDDDHLAIRETTECLTERIRSGAIRPNTMYCFSGLNLFPFPGGELGILESDPISGGGDIGFFPVTEQTYFVHDRRFERFHRGSLRREFSGFLYWHLKYLKRDMGFANYELDKNPQSRYAKRRSALQNGGGRAVDLARLIERQTPRLRSRLLGLFSEKCSLVVSRDRSIAAMFPDRSVTEAIARTTEQEFSGDII
ncbi:MAG: hypothetical protein RL215_1583 [Planctomycetota bacterium]|jgi:hypothetical protein